MYSSTDEIVLHSQRAFDLCRDQVYDYEDCRQLDYMGKYNPKLCEKESFNLLKCYEKVEQVEPICMEPMNLYRECYFKYSGNVMLCEGELTLFNRCQENPKWYFENEHPKIHGIRKDYNPAWDRPKY